MGVGQLSERNEPIALNSAKLMLGRGWLHVGVAILKVVVHELGVVTLELLSQHLCIEWWVHGVLYDTSLLSSSLSRDTDKILILHFHLQDNLLRLHVYQREICETYTFNWDIQKCIKLPLK